MTKRKQDSLEVENFFMHPRGRLHDVLTKNI